MTCNLLARWWSLWLVQDSMTLVSWYRSHKDDSCDGVVTSMVPIDNGIDLDLLVYSTTCVFMHTWILFHIFIFHQELVASIEISKDKGSECIWQVYWREKQGVGNFFQGEVTAPSTEMKSHYWLIYLLVEPICLINIFISN